MYLGCGSREQQNRLQAPQQSAWRGPRVAALDGQVLVHLHQSATLSGQEATGLARGL